MNTQEDKEKEEEQGWDGIRLLLQTTEHPHSPGFQPVEGKPICPFVPICTNVYILLLKDYYYVYFSLESVKLNDFLKNK